MTFEDELRLLYKENNVLKDGVDVLLHENCKFKNNCWNYVAKKNRIHDRNKIALPYIGDNYKNDLLVIGLNFYESGGLNRLREIIGGTVKECFKNGERKIPYGHDKTGAVKECFSKRKEGSIFWHRVAVYTNIFLNKSILEQPEDLVDIFEKIVYMEAIKCSPKGDKSRPEKDMFITCPKKYLFNEIRIIKPNNILILHKDTSDLLKETFGYRNEYTPNKKMEYFELKPNNIKVFRIIHPSAHGGNSKTIYNDFLKLIKEKNNGVRGHGI